MMLGSKMRNNFIGLSSGVFATCLPPQRRARFSAVTLPSSSLRVEPSHPAQLAAHRERKTASSFAKNIYTISPSFDERSRPRGDAHFLVCSGRLRDFMLRGTKSYTRDFLKVRRCYCADRVSLAPPLWAATLITSSDHLLRMTA